LNCSASSVKDFACFSFLKHSNLTHLNLLGSAARLGGLDKTRSQALGQCLVEATLLSTLLLNDNRDLNSGAIDLIKLLPSSLTSLSLFSCTIHDDEKVDYFLDYLARSQLTRLDFRYFCFPLLSSPVL
jgi:hypothetical protein